jgi:pSer/pThr/pTyr-binding forkhead associated (FHA) protein
VLCSNCGHENPADAHFCSNCGTSLKEETTVSFTPIEAEEESREVGGQPRAELEPGQALLVVERGPNAGSKFLVDKDVTTAGRHPESDIFLDDVTVSRRHAEFRREDGRFLIHDVGSLNGTYVNRKRVEDSQLADGDELQIGKFKLTFYVGE